jgi:hypothetical protein
MGEYDGTSSAFKKYKGGLLGTVSKPMKKEGDSNSKKRTFFPGQIPLQPTASMTLTNNITFDVSSPQSDAKVTDKKNKPEFADRDFKCGIYPRPLSPFLHGRTLMTGVSATLQHNEPGYPRRMPDALGDHVAFAALEQAMTRIGMLDWRPDGVVNSKLENGPDQMVCQCAHALSAHSPAAANFADAARVCALSRHTGRRHV